MLKGLVADALSKVSLLSTLTSDDITNLARSARTRHYRANDPIVLQGDLSASMFVLVSGCVKVHRTSERGTDVVLAILGPAECFGELSFIDGLPRSAVVTAIDDTTIIELTAESIHIAVLASPGLAWSLLKALATRLREQNAVVETLVTRDVTGRVADLLLRLSRNHGCPMPSTRSINVQDPAVIPIVITLPLSQSEIGTFVGATRERVSRVMADMRKNTIITRQPGTGRIVVLDRAKLERIVEIG